MPLSLGTSVQFVKGVGPRWANTLARRGICTVEDLLYTLPFRYEDRSQLRPIQALLEGEAATVLAQIQELRWIRTRKGSVMLRLTAADGTGSLLCTWYNAAYLRDRVRSGQTVALFGRVGLDQGKRSMQQPELEILDAEASDSDALEDSLRLGRIVPVYEAIAGLSSGWLRRFIHRALAAVESIPETLPSAVRQQFALVSRGEALRQVHFPAPESSLAELQKARTPAHLALLFEELFFLQSGLELKRRRIRNLTAPRLAVDGAVRASLKRILPFHPTQDQKQVLREIAVDLGSGRPMRRLLQGDVGSGKTIVGLQAAAIAIENGYQVAWMAPTQILAEQHFLHARTRMPHYRVALVTAGARRRSDEPAPQLAIGTQALLQDSFPWSRLGLVVVDEQHRFGVLQRFQLMQRGGASVHLLVMTATPIPRTLALALYGDLETSVIHQAPPGAPPIVTRLVPAARSNDLYEFVRGQLRAGRQAFFVYPLVEESDVLDLKPALRMVEHLRRAYSEFTVGLLHGRLSPEEKTAVMEQFRSGQCQVLVATTVVEVGVDVPNATVMVIEHAERFGIAQLHQLRGRVGRPQPVPAPVGARRSCCFLLHGAECGDLAMRRLQAVAASRDGFALAETDLCLRGPGEFFGTRQSGQPVFTLADPLRDVELMERARDAAQNYIHRANGNELRLLVAQIQQRWQRRYGLIEVG